MCATAFEHAVQSRSIFFANCAFLLQRGNNELHTKVDRDVCKCEKMRIKASFARYNYREYRSTIILQRLLIVMCVLFCFERLRLYDFRRDSFFFTNHVAEVSREGSVTRKWL